MPEGHASGPLVYLALAVAAAICGVLVGLTYLGVNGPPFKTGVFLTVASIAWGVLLVTIGAAAMMARKLPS